MNADGPAVLPRGIEAGTNGPVSWLEAVDFSLPGANAPVGPAMKSRCAAVHGDARQSLIQWRGRAGVAPASYKGPFVVIQLSHCD